LRQRPIGATAGEREADDRAGGEPIIEAGRAARGGGGEIVAADDGADEGGVGDLIVADVIDLQSASIGVAQQHVAFAKAAEIADARELPIQAHRAQRGGINDVVVADVVDLVTAAVADDTAARMRRHKKRGSLTTGRKPFYFNGLYATIDDPLAAFGTVASGINAAGQIVGTYQNATGLHGFLETTFPNPSPPAGTTADMILRGANSHIVDAKCLGAIGGQGIVNGGVETVAGEVKEAVQAGGVGVSPDDLARGVDARYKGFAGSRRGNVNGGVSAAAQEEAVESAGVVLVSPDDLA